MSNVTRPDTDFRWKNTTERRLAEAELRLHRLLGSIPTAASPPDWEDVSFEANWRSLANYPVQVRLLAYNRVVTRGIAERINTGFSFAATTRNIFTLPTDFEMAGVTPSGYQIQWANARDSAGVNSMYRLVVVEATRLFYVDAGLAGIGANGAVGTWIYFDGLTFELATTT